MSVYSEYGRNAGNLIMGQGAAQADATRQSGAIWANTLGNLGNIALAVPEQRRQESELRQRQQVVDANQKRIDAAEASRIAIANAISGSLGPNGKINKDELAKRLGNTADAGAIPELFKMIDDGDERDLRLRSLRNQLEEEERAQFARIGDEMALLKDPQNQAGYGIMKFAQLVKEGKVPQEHVQQWTQGMLDEDGRPNPEKVAATIQGIRSKAQPQKKEPYTLGRTDIRFSGDNVEIARGMGAEEKPPTLGSFEDYVPRYAKEHGKAVNQLTPADIEDARKRYQQSDDRPRVTVQMNDNSDAEAIADAIISGDQPPVLTGLYRNAGPVRAWLAKKGYNLTEATLDWQATQKHIATLNNAQQTRLNQAINQLPDLLDSVDDLASQWVKVKPVDKAGRFQVLNKANLATAKSGIYGSEAASIARQLDTQIADVTADLGVVYMGGNSPTERAFDLSRTALSADWDEKTLRDMVKLAKKNVKTRQNSIRNTGVQGASPNNRYAPAQPEAPAGDPLGILSK